MVGLKEFLELNFEEYFTKYLIPKFYFNKFQIVTFEKFNIVLRLGRKKNIFFSSHSNFSIPQSLSLFDLEKSRKEPKKIDKNNFCVIFFSLDNVCAMITGGKLIFCVY